MKERERIVVSALVSALLLIFLVVAFHRSERFAGSLLGGVLGVSGSLLMVVSAGYSLIKRFPGVRTRVIKHVTMRGVLTAHAYTGLLGAFLVLLHTGHKFESPLGIALTAVTIGVVVSGYAGHYLLVQVFEDLREQKVLLAGLEAQYRYYTAELTARPEQRALVRLYGRFLPRVFGRFFAGPDDALQVPARIVEVTSAIADVEYGIKTNDLLKKLFSRWLVVHIALSVALLTLLGLHIWSGVHFGLRWFR